MSWLLVAFLAILAFVVLAFVLKASRPGWEAIGAALLLGIAGYGLQGSPGQPGSPKAPRQNISKDPAALVEARGKIAGAESVPSNNWIVVADALARNGQYANAASILLAAVEEDPDDGDAWLAMANALVSHADGFLTPAASFAFNRAAEAEPDHPGPPFFLGLALAQSGRFQDARALWANLLANSPDDAPWRGDLEQRLERLDAFIEGQERAQSRR